MRVLEAIGRFIDEQIFERIRLHGFTFVRDALVVLCAYTLAEAVRFDGPIPARDVEMLFHALPAIALIHAVFSYIFGIHRRLWQYVGIRDVRALIHASMLSVLVVGVLDAVLPGERPVPLAVVPMGGALALLGLVAARLWRDLLRFKTRGSGEWERILIVGAGQAGRVVVTDLLDNPHLRQLPIGFVDDDPRKRQMKIHGVPVLGTMERLRDIIRDQHVDIVGVAIPSATSHQLDKILAMVQDTSARIMILPSHLEVMSGNQAMRLRNINLDDLLEREPVAVLEDPVVRDSISGRNVLVTGARGSIGFELCKQILRLNPASVLALDNNETGLFYLQRELRSEVNAGLLMPILADVTELSKLSQVFQRYRPDVVFHAAAYKHVPMLEDYPEEAVWVNVVGTLNLCRMATDFGCERFVFVSTDKAVDPVNVLGFSKRIGELIVRAHSAQSSDLAETIFCSVRFGNVVGSRGSALPEFVHQIDAGGPVTITHPDVERYFMTIAEAVSLVIRAGAEAQGGELFMLDMGQPIKIADLVKRIIRLRGLRIGKDIELRYTGLRPGEKLTEELVFPDEQVRPTSYEGILCVEDDVKPSLLELDSSIAVLVNAASQNDPVVLRDFLSRAARGERVSRKGRLSSTAG